MPLESIITWVCFIYIVVHHLLHRRQIREEIKKQLEVK